MDWVLIIIVVAAWLIHYWIKRKTRNEGLIEITFTDLDGTLREVDSTPEPELKHARRGKHEARRGKHESRR